MFQIDCTMVPQAVTDFAFDHLKDDVPINSSALGLDYESQEVSVDVGDMDTVYTVRDAIQERAYEKIADLEQETENGFNTGFEVNELRAARDAVSNITVVTED